MAVNYTEEQLNSVDKSFLIQLLLQQQEQLNALTKELHASNKKMQLLMKQSLMIWNSNPQNSQSERGRKRLIFPGLRSDGLTIIYPRRN